MTTSDKEQPSSKPVDEAHQAWLNTFLEDRGTLNAFRAGWEARAAHETRDDGPAR